MTAGGRGRDELLQAVGAALRRTIVGVVVFNHQVVERLRLGANEGQFLNLLELHGALTPGQLAEHTGLGTGTVSGVLDRLERAGYARRERGSDDRRKVIVTLDRDRVGREILPLYAGQDRRVNELLERYADGELAVIADFLQRLAATGEKAPPPAPGPSDG